MSGPQSHLQDFLLAKQSSMEKAIEKASYRIVVIVLTFTLNPLIFVVYEPIRASGFIPFVIFTILINLLFCVMYNALIKACAFSGATTYGEILKYYFSRLDRVISFIIFVYCFTTIYLCQLSLANTYQLFAQLMTHDVVLSNSIAISVVICINILIIFIASMYELEKLLKMCYVSIVMWIVCILGQGLIVCMNTDVVSSYFSDWNNMFKSESWTECLYMQISLMNCFQSIVLVYRELAISTGVRGKAAVSRSVNIAIGVTIAFYIVFGLIDTIVNEVILRDKNQHSQGVWFQALMAFFYLAKPILLILQVALNMVTARESAFKIIYSNEVEISAKAMFITNIVINTLAASVIFALIFSDFSTDADIDFNVQLRGYEVLAFLSLFVGVGLPLILMIKMGEDSLWRVCGIAAAMLAIFLVLVDIMLVKLGLYGESIFSMQME